MFATRICGLPQRGSSTCPRFQREAEEQNVFAIRTAGDPANWTQSAQGEIQAVVPAIATTDVKTLVGQRDEQLVNERLLAMLSACFGGLALILAAIGVYGVVTYSVTQRTAELGLRIALGASRAALLWLVIRGTLDAHRRRRRARGGGARS